MSLLLQRVACAAIDGEVAYVASVPCNAFRKGQRNVLTSLESIDESVPEKMASEAAWFEVFVQNIRRSDGAVPEKGTAAKR